MKTKPQKKEKKKKKKMIAGMVVTNLYCGSSVYFIMLIHPFDLIESKYGFVHIYYPQQSFLVSWLLLKFPIYSSIILLLILYGFVIW